MWRVLVHIVMYRRNRERKNEAGGTRVGLRAWSLIYVQHWINHVTYITTGMPIMSITIVIQLHRPRSHTPPFIRIIEYKCQPIADNKLQFPTTNHRLGLSTAIGIKWRLDHILQRFRTSIESEFGRGDVIAIVEEVKVVPIIAWEISPRIPGEG